MRLIDIPLIESFITDVVTQYQGTCPQLCEYLDDVYVRLSKGGRGIDVAELRFIEYLQCEDEGKKYWLSAELAQNTFHHFVHDFGIADRWPMLLDA